MRNMEATEKQLLFSILKLRSPFILKFNILVYMCHIMHVLCAYKLMSASVLKQKVNRGTCTADNNSE